MYVLLLKLVFSTAIAEGIFFMLRSLKIWVRTRITKNRLTGLELLNVHKDIKVCPKKVVKRCSVQKAGGINCKCKP